MTVGVRTREDIERDLLSKRRERALYVSPQGVAKCHAELDRLLDEWELRRPTESHSSSTASA